MNTSASHAQFMFSLWCIYYDVNELLWRHKAVVSPNDKYAYRLFLRGFARRMAKHF